MCSHKTALIFLYQLQGWEFSPNTLHFDNSLENLTKVIENSYTHGYTLLQEKDKD